MCYMPCNPKFMLKLKHLLKNFFWVLTLVLSVTSTIFLYHFEAPTKTQELTATEMQGYNEEENTFHLPEISLIKSLIKALFIS